MGGRGSFEKGSKSMAIGGCLMMKHEGEECKGTMWDYVEISSYQGVVKEGWFPFGSGIEEESGGD